MQGAHKRSQETTAHNVIDVNPVKQSNGITSALDQLSPLALRGRSRVVQLSYRQAAVKSVSSDGWPLDYRPLKLLAGRLPCFRHFLTMLGRWPTDEPFQSGVEQPARRSSDVKPLCPDRPRCHDDALPSQTRHGPRRSCRCAVAACRDHVWLPVSLAPSCVAAYQHGCGGHHE